MTQASSKTDTRVEALFQEAARLAAETIEGHADRDRPVVHHVDPRELQRLLGLELPEEGQGLESVLELARKTVRYSVRTGHPRFANQLFGGYDVAGILGEWITALTNTSMYTYEAAPVATVVELALVERLCRYVGFTEGEGVLSPGGSITNLMATLTARHRAFPHVKREGLRPDDRPVLFVSEEAHYSAARAAFVTGIGLEGAVQIPVDEVGRMRADELARAIQREGDAGRKPFMIITTSGSTVSGAFDPITPIADIAQRHSMWLHVDASYGGSALLSRRHRHLLEGIDRADSVAWNPHKMMGVPLSCSALLLREKGQLVAAHGMNADYLFHGDSEKAWDLGDRGLQCGRRVDALKLWFSWQVHGDAGYERRIDRMFELAAGFREAVRAREGFRLIREQEGTNVCFRYLPPEFRHTTGEERGRREHEATIAIRGQMARSGSFLINYATLDGAATFRLVASNPEATLSDYTALLDAIAVVRCQSKNVR
jgi:glutamate/tyrosine decarboxylase-like PLP-dependent enzyme